MDSNMKISYRPAESSSYELLEVPVQMKLEELYTTKFCPKILRESLELDVTWHERNETTVLKALQSRYLNPAFQAVLLILDAEIRQDSDIFSFEDMVQQKIKIDPEGILLIHLGQKDKLVGKSAVRLTPSDIPITACYASVTVVNEMINDATLILTGVSQSPYLIHDAAKHMIGEKFTESLVAMTVDQVYESVSPRGDYRGSAEYRKSMAKVCTRRALAQCLEEVKA